MTLQRLCKNCSTAFTQYNTTQNLCQKCTYNKYSKPRSKPIKRFGKKAQAWIERRHEWIKAHPATNGYWDCYLMISPNCLGRMDIDQLTLDHVIPKSGTDRATANSDENLLPACIFCNNLKASRRLENIPEFTNWAAVSKRGTI